MRNRWILLVWLVTLAVASCAPAGAEPLPADPQQAPSREPSPVPSQNPLQLADTPEPKEMRPDPPAAEKFVDLAKKDLAERLKSPVAEITLVSTAEVTWPNAALGCPRPGMVYAQGRVPGYQIRLQAAGMEYTYNTDLQGQVVLCPENNSDDPASFSPTTPGPTKPIGPPRN